MSEIHYTKNGIRILPHHNRRIHKLIQKIRKSGAYIQWQRAILKRDHNRCAKCRNKNDLTAHHNIELSQILTRNKVRTMPQAHYCDELWELDNGETLCLDCHRREHGLIAEELDVENIISGRSG